MNAAEACAAVESHREELVVLCGRLVATPSITPPGDTRAAADAARSWLHERGIDSALHVLAHDKPNLVAVVNGARPGPLVVLNGHLDTMDPGDESRWTVPVFELTQNDGRLYGLGMGNMKGGVAALCLSASILAEQASSLHGTVVLTLVSDEVRFGDHGSAHLIETLPWIRGDAVISGEGAGWMKLAIAEKGVAWVDLEVIGPAGHASSAERGTTATARLAAAIAAIDELNDWYVASPDGLGSVLGDPPNPGSRVAVNVGVIGAGEARSMAAPRAYAYADVRLPPGLGIDVLMKRIDEAIAPTGVRATCVRGWNANWTAPADPLVVAATESIRAVRDSEPVMTVRHPASDVMRWRRLGVPGICFGPQPTFSAGIDDYAVEQDILDCAAVYILTTLRFGRRWRPSQ